MNLKYSFFYVGASVSPDPELQTCGTRENIRDQIRTANDTYFAIQKYKESEEAEGKVNENITAETHCAKLYLSLSSGH